MDIKLPETHPIGTAMSDALTGMLTGLKSMSVLSRSGGFYWELGDDKISFQITKTDGDIKTVMEFCAQAQFYDPPKPEN